jgi:L-aspartate oxidase
VVYAHRASVRLASDLRTLPEIPGADWRLPKLRTAGEDAGDVERRIRDLMWENVGIVRSDDRLEAARAEIDLLSSRFLGRDGTGPGAMHTRQVEFMRDVSALVVRCAQRRRESRGLHFTESHPRRDNEHFLRDTVLAR